MRYSIYCLLVALLAGTLTGCTPVKGNVGKMSIFPVPNEEVAWIRNGEPIEFEGIQWYPEDSFDVLLDNEVYLMGEYRGVQFFVDKADVRPYERLYTKFGTYKFRRFKVKGQDD